MSNTLRLMRGAVAAQKTGFFFLYHPAVYRAVWAEAQDLGDDRVLQNVLESAGIPATELIAETESPQVKERLRQNTELAVQRGVFGAPTFFVGDEMFWGK